MIALNNKSLFAQMSARIDDLEAPFVHSLDGHVLTYKDMISRTAQFANVLIELGVKPGDRVAVQVEKSLDALFLYLGCMRVGGVFLPLNTAYREKELAYFLGDALPCVFVCETENFTSLKAMASQNGVNNTQCLKGETGSLRDRADGADKNFNDVHRSGDDLAAILYTSGTTGRSKGAMLSHDNLVSNALTLVNFWQFSSKDVLLHALPIYHTHGLFVASNTVLFSGASMLFHERFDVDAILADLPKASVMMGVPTFYVRLLANAGLNEPLVKSMRLFVSGSAPLSPETHKEFTARTGHKILERYGMTETNMNTSNPYEGERKPGTVGLALPDVEVRITDQETKKPVANGGVGMIEIRGPNVFKGYWNMPEKTAEEFRVDGFFISGDLGRFDQDGYLSIVGREKDLIISGGFNVYPAEVENAIDAIEGISDVAVIGVPHADFGEAVTAVVVAKNDQENDQENSQKNGKFILEQLSQDLAKYKMPKEIFFVKELPRNKMGKVQKNELRATYKDTFVASN